MSATPPTVSIAIRAWRRETLGQAITSVLTQTYTDLELVIYDDAGTLEDVTKVNARRATHGAPQREIDERVRYHRADRKYQASGRFRVAVGLCRGRYIGVLDDDDRYEPEFVARLVDALEQHPRAGVAFCRTTWESNGRRVRPADARPAGVQPDAATQMLRDGWTICPSLMVIRRAALEEVERLQAMPDDVAPDVFVNVLAALAGWQHVLVDAPLVVLGWHAGQSSRTPAAYDVAVATLRTLRFGDPRLAALRDRELGRTLLVRAFERLRVGDAAGAKKDLRSAAEAAPASWRSYRRLLRLAASSSTIGRLATHAWLSCTPRGRRRRLPPTAI